jgi:hypothetical protein
MHEISSYSLKWLAVLGKNINLRMAVKEMLFEIIFGIRLMRTD